MSTERTYMELTANALAAEFGFDPAAATPDVLAAAQAIVNRRAGAALVVRAMDRARCRPVLTGDPHDVLELVARRDWPHPLL